MTTCHICSASLEARHSYGICSTCFSKDLLREYDRWDNAVHKANKKGIEATLSLLQLLATVSDFNGLCALCEEYTYSVILMIDDSKGLTYNNIIVACKACAKHHREGFDTAMERVKLYLASDVEAKSTVQDSDIYEDITSDTI